MYGLEVGRAGGMDAALILVSFRPLVAQSPGKVYYMKNIDFT
jgi:hypothetical protein